MDKKSLKKQWPILFFILFIPAILITTGVIGSSNHKENNTVQTREGAIEQSSLSAATESLKGAIELADRMYDTTSETSFEFTARLTYGRYANFGIVQHVNEVKSVGLVDEMAINFSGATNNEHAEVDPKTNQVIAFHRETDYSGESKTYAELEQIARQYVERIYPDFAQVESTLTFEDNSKTSRPEGSNHFFTWNDMNFESELPEGADTERPPFIQVGITSTGYIFSYNNTIDLYRNALEEFNLTQ